MTKVSYIDTGVSYSESNENNELQFIYPPIEFKIKRKNKIIRYFRLCKRKTDGMIGYYEYIDGNFYPFENYISIEKENKDE